MQRSFVVRAVAVLSCLAVSLYADVIVLKNGDRLTAALVKKDGEKLTVKSEFLGQITIPWSAVVSLEVEKPVHVVLSDGTTINSTIAAAGAETRIERSSIPVRAPLSELRAIRNDEEQRRYERLEAPGWTELWKGYFDIGFALARGNARTDTYTTAFEAFRMTRADKARVYFNQIYSNASLNRVAAQTAGAVRGGWAYDHDITGRTFFNLFNDYEHDQFQNLDLRYVAGVGAGVHLFKGERTALSVLAGGSYNRENFFDGERRNSAEAYWGDDLRFRLTGVTSLTQSFRMFNNLSTSGDYRMNGDLGFETLLRKWLSVQITASDRFLSRPVQGRQRNDILLTTGFRVTFSR